MTREELNANLSAMADQFNLGADAMPIFDEIRADYERLETSAAELTEANTTLTAERDRAIQERDDAKQAYRDRFFNRDTGAGGNPGSDANQSKVKSLEDIFNG